MKRKIYIFTIIIIISFIYLIYQISFFRTRNVSIETNKLSNDFKITQISDYHNNKFINKKRLIKSIGNFNPDIILLTGDIIDGKTDNLDNVRELLSMLKSLNIKTYFIYGNHEYRNPSLTEFENILEEMDVLILKNEFNNIDFIDGKINLVGLDYYADFSTYKSLLESLNQDTFNIVASHSPNKIPQYDLGIENLVLSGHTHGGQVRLPILGAVLAPGQEICPSLSKGIYPLKSGKLYIDSGLGNSVINLRVLNPVQISYIKIEGKK